MPCRARREEVNCDISRQQLEPRDIYPGETGPAIAFAQMSGPTFPRDREVSLLRVSPDAPRRRGIHVDPTPFYREPVQNVAEFKPSVAFQQQDLDAHSDAHHS